MEQERVEQKRKPAFAGWARVLLLVLPYIITVGIFQFIGLFAAGLPLTSSGDVIPTLPQTLVVMLFNLAGTVFIVSLFVRFVDEESLKCIGFQIKGHVLDIFLGLIMGAITITLGFLCLVQMNQISVVQITFDFYKVLMGFIMFVMVAFSEEILLRGYVLKNLMQSFNKYVALVVSSALFSIMHFFNPGFDWLCFLNIFLAGIFLGLSYIYTKNLWYPIALHLSWNFFQGSVFGFSVSGNDTYAIITQTRVEDNIMNGGNFGFEGSILTIGFVAVAILVTWFIFRNRQQDCCG